MSTWATNLPRNQGQMRYRNEDPVAAGASALGEADFRYALTASTVVALASPVPLDRVIQALDDWTIYAPGIYTCQSSGWYFVSGQVQTTALASTYINLETGAEYPTILTRLTSAAGASASAALIHYINANERLSLQAVGGATYEGLTGGVLNAPNTWLQAYKITM